MIYQSEEIRIEVENRIKQFENGLITLSELIHCLTICDYENQIKMLNKLLEERKEKRDEI